MKNLTRRYCLCFALLAALVLALLVWNVTAGSVDFTPGELLAALLGPRDEAGIIWGIRLPRVLAAAVLGGALSVSGFLLQTFFANPIAGPFVLGISSGAKLTVSLVMVGFLSRGIVISSAALIVAAFIGSMASMGFILLLSRRVRQMSMLVVSGVMIGYICSAITDFVVTFADDSNIVNLRNWSLGSFSGTSWENVRLMVLVVGVSLGLTFLLSKPIGAYQMGEVYAQNMGVDIKRFRVELILLSSVLSACVTAFAGPISFVGIAAPHLIKGLFRTAKPVVIIPACFLGGAAFCLGCDLIARTAFAPRDMSISTVTAVFGAPVVLYLMAARRGGRGGAA
ncbi:MAG: iron ABC transporter permease [Oscillospiraceae bacterium]|jgi:iron complex transport system permease protein|nr:iron ABC transporter permease [Oscillospiraceae bacterium]